MTGGLEQTVDRGLRLVLMVFLLSSSALTLFVGVRSFSLRPIGDDYCIAAGANRGPFVQVIGDWNSWQGFLSASVLNSLLSGLPVLHLPWGVSSAFSFLLATAAVSAVTLLCLSRSSTLGVHQLALFVPFVVTSFWGFWWSRATFGTTDFPETLHGNSSLDDVDAHTLWSAVMILTARWVTHSTNIQAAYLIGMAAFTGIAVWLLTWRRRHPVVLTACVILFATFTGFYLPAVALGSIPFALLLWIIAIRKPNSFVQGPPGLYVTYIVVTLVAQVAALSSPGMTTRRGAVLESSTRQPLSISDAVDQPIALLRWVFPRSIIEWIVAWANVGSVLVVLLMAAVTFLVLKSYNVDSSTINLKGAALIAGGLFAFSFVLSVSNRAAEAFAYPGVWHQVMATLMVFFAATAFGFVIGCKLAYVQPRHRGITLLVVVAGSLSLILIAVANVNLARDVEQRLESWQSGPAPLPKMPDIEERINCWDSLSEMRNSPARALHDGDPLAN